MYCTFKCLPISLLINTLCRGKKRKGITHSFLVEDEGDERWVWFPAEIALGQNHGQENEVQEVVVDIGEETGKPTGIGI